MRIIKILFIIIVCFTINYPQTIKDLPKPVQNTLDSLVNKYIPILKNNIHLIKIQKNNLDELSKNGYLGYGKIITDYDIKFMFNDKDLDINNYKIELGFDKYGQLLQANIPYRTKHFTKKLIPSVQAIEYGKNYCKAKKYNIDSLETIFCYNSDYDCFVWEVSAYEKRNKNSDHIGIRDIIINAETGDFISERYSIEMINY